MFIVAAIVTGFVTMSCAYCCCSCCFVWLGGVTVVCWIVLLWFHSGRGRSVSVQFWGKTMVSILYGLVFWLAPKPAWMSNDDELSRVLRCTTGRLHRPPAKGKLHVWVGRVLLKEREGGKGESRWNRLMVPNNY